MHRVFIKQSCPLFAASCFRYATARRLPEDVIKSMLAIDMPIQIGLDADSKNHNFEREYSPVARHVVGRSHHHSWWHIMVDCSDQYLSMVKSYLLQEATHAQIVALTRQVGPDGNSVLINCVSNKCRLVFHELLLLYQRYEILLVSSKSNVKLDEGLDGVQTFMALDHGLSIAVPHEDYFSNERTCFEDENSVSTAVRFRNGRSDETAIEVGKTVSRLQIYFTWAQTQVLHLCIL